MEKQINELPNGITAEMIASAKAKYGDKGVRMIDLIDDNTGNVKTVLVCVPSRIVMGQYKRYESIDPKKAEEILVKACLLSHKDEVLADDGLFYGALSGIAELIQVRRAVVKNC